MPDDWLGITSPRVDRVDRDLGRREQREAPPRRRPNTRPGTPPPAPHSDITVQPDDLPTVGSHLDIRV